MVKTKNHPILVNVETPDKTQTILVLRRRKYRRRKIQRNNNCCWAASGVFVKHHCAETNPTLASTGVY